MEKVKIKTEYITLGQFIKFVNLISTGGEEKIFCASHKIIVNGENENRRGRKLRDGDKIEIDNSSYELCL